MTSDKHERASDRCAETLLKLEAKNGTNMTLLSWFRDEPMTQPEMLAQAISRL